MGQRRTFDMWGTVVEGSGLLYPFFIRRDVAVTFVVDGDGSDFLSSEGKTFTLSGNITAMPLRGYVTGGSPLFLSRYEYVLKNRMIEDEFTLHGFKGRIVGVVQKDWSKISNVMVEVSPVSWGKKIMMCGVVIMGVAVQKKVEVVQ